MFGFVVRRILSTIPVLGMVALLVFLMLRRKKVSLLLVMSLIRKLIILIQLWLLLFGILSRHWIRQSLKFRLVVLPPRTTVPIRS